MSGETTKSLSDLFKKYTPEQFAKGMKAIEKPFGEMTVDEQMDYLLVKILRHPLFCKSRPPFDKDFFVRIYRTCEDATPHHFRKILLEMDEKYWRTEANRKEGEKIINWRRAFTSWLNKYMVNWRYLMAKKSGKLSAPARVQTRQDFKRKCAGCSGLFDFEMTHTMPGTDWNKRYCKTCYDKEFEKDELQRKNQSVASDEGETASGTGSLSDISA